MLGLTKPQVYKPIFDKTEKSNNFELYIFPDSKTGGISYEIVTDEIEKDWEVTDITAADLKNETIAPFIIEEYKEQVTKRIKNDEYMRTLTIYNRSIFQIFDSVLRTEVYLYEDDTRLVSLDGYNSSFITYRSWYLYFQRYF